MKIEAIERMKSLGIFPQTIGDFEKDDKISVSEPPFGAWYWLDDDEVKRVREWEEEHDALVYAVIRSFTTIGTMDSYLFVSKHKEDWFAERPKGKEGIVFSYVKNLDFPEFSEFGSIAYKVTGAKGLIRTE